MEVVPSQSATVPDPLELFEKNQVRPILHILQHVFCVELAGMKDLHDACLTSGLIIDESVSISQLYGQNLVKLLYLFHDCRD